ncbi:MAG: hypothetical protein ACRDG5_05635, partial [Anaerolineales bacterium]
TLPPVQTVEDLILALGEAGAWVARSGELEAGLFGVPGEVLTVNGVAVEVYGYPSQVDRERVSATIAPDGSTLAGQPLIWRDPPHIWAQGDVIVVYQGTDGPTILLLDAILGEALVRTGGVGMEPYPPAVTAAIGELARRLQVDPAQIEVMSFEEREWPDACLGLAGPDEMCAMMITPGWRVVLRAGGREYAARTDMAGLIVRLE